MSLLDEVRTYARITSRVYDSELQMLVDAAIADMRRVGVRDDALAEDTMSPLVKSAIAMYVRSRFGYDNSEAQRFAEEYRRTVTDLVNGHGTAKYMGDGS